MCAVFVVAGDFIISVVTVLVTLVGGGGELNAIKKRKALQCEAGTMDRSSTDKIAS